MMALASTEEKALLRYLYMRGEALNCHDHGHNLAEALRELDEIDHRNNDRFGFSSYPDAYGMRGVVGMLSSMGLVRADYENPHVVLTESGKEFAEHLYFYHTVNIAVQQYLEGMRQHGIHNGSQ
jgi:hypothetical protein